MTPFYGYGGYGGGYGQYGGYYNEGWLGWFRGKGYQGPASASCGHIEVSQYRIDEFIQEYESAECLAYAKLSDAGRHIIAKELKRQNIEHEIFDRGSEGGQGGKTKAVASVRKTILRRQVKRGTYQSKEAILEDMHDLAGIRVTLYYPNDFKKVESFILSRFKEVKPPQDWPDEEFGAFPYPTLDMNMTGLRDISGRSSRFPGYLARHYRVQLADADIDETAVKGKTLEIQLMSLLMHAWSKIHHELIYKPRAGLLQADEDDERLLDLSNGAIIAGEQVLRQLQINLDRKRERGRLPFDSVYEAWTYLEKTWINKKDGLSETQQQWLQKACLEDGPIKNYLLYESLRMLGFNTPEKFEILLGNCITFHDNNSLTLHPGGNPSHSFESHFNQRVFISLVDMEEFAAIEAKELQLPQLLLQQGDSHLTRSQTAKMVRYKALIICNAMRMIRCATKCMWEHIKSYVNCPSTQELLDILHPESRKSFDPASLTRLDKFCSYMLKADGVISRDEPWQMCCAVSRLTCFSFYSDLDETPDTSNLESKIEFLITQVPKSLTQILDLLQQRDKSSGEGTLSSIPLPTPDLIPSAKYTDQLHPIPSEREGIWSDGLTETCLHNGSNMERVNIMQLSFSAVRQYLDRPEFMQI
ncbi:hypothetical protein HD806DRAFT_515572 [Xylariaceae sp. AK1471]|nr:hypothetical protein HD806DRAFT_515572 [Xylariaceae sp. AK1471]